MPHSASVVPVRERPAPEAPARTVPAAPSAERLHWVDVAKAGAVILVVVYHVGRTGLAHLLPGSGSQVVAAWGLFNEALLPVRMPLFFLASGLLAVPALSRSWSRLWRPRVANLLWPFALWGLVYAVTSGLAYGTDDFAGHLRENLAAIPAGGTAYWYLAVLVVLFVIARLLRSRAPVLVLASVAALGVAPLVPDVVSGLIGEVGGANVGRICYFALWFFLGCFARPVLARIAALDPWPLLGVSVPLYAGLAYLVYVRDTATPAVVLTVVGVVAAVAASVLLARRPLARRLCRYLAGRTLAIYVVHPVLVTVLVALVRRGDGTALPLDSVALDLAIVPVVTAAFVWLSVALYDLSSRVWLGWLFAPPRRRARSSDRAGSSVSPARG